MLLGEPPATAYDVNFRIFGFPVRVSVWFWVVGLIYGSSLLSMAPIPPWRAFILWTAAVLISILIHELGHCFAFKKHGLDSRIVLYHFGGLAIPGAWSGNRSSNQSPWSQIEISAAGPFFQIVSALILGVVLLVAGFEFPFVDALGIWGFITSGFQRLGFEGGRPLPSVDLGLFVYYYSLVSIWWGIFNLLPIYPLDGGQISRSLGVAFFDQEGAKYAYLLSMVVAGYLAITRFQGGDQLMAFFFASFAYTSYQAFQASGTSYRGWR